jgi:8-amino-7-oxononanoate synthase
LPPAIIGATTASLRKIETLSSERKKILFLAEYLRKQLNQMGLNTGLSNTHIIPIIVNDEKSALNLAAYLKEKDITVKAIRPPVVPSGTSRIRICINARHTMEDVKNLIREIKAWNKKLV